MIRITCCSIRAHISGIYNLLCKYYDFCPILGVRKTKHMLKALLTDGKTGKVGFKWLGNRGLTARFGGPADNFSNSSFSLQTKLTTTIIVQKLINGLQVFFTQVYMSFRCFPWVDAIHTLSHKVTPLLSLMLILAPSSTRRLTVSRSPCLMEVRSKSSWWRRRNKNCKSNSPDLPDNLVHTCTKQGLASPCVSMSVNKENYRNRQSI